MRIRLSPKGDILRIIKNLFDLISDGKFIDAVNMAETLKSPIMQYYISRGINRDKIITALYRLNTVLQSNRGAISFKKKLCYNRIEVVMGLLKTEDVELVARNKYDRVMQIYECLQEDVQQFAKSRRFEDGESIRGDFADMRALEPRFMTDNAEYALFQDVVKQIGLCIGMLIRSSFGEKDGPYLKKMHVTFENLFPKIESLIASKKYREEPKKEGEQQLSELKVKEINDLAQQQDMNIEEISNFTGISKEIVEDVLFPES